MNRDIAVYMEAEFRTDYNDYYFEDHPSLIIRGRWACEVEKMYYHNSFDWLMPVWQKLRGELVAKSLIRQDQTKVAIKCYISDIEKSIAQDTDLPTAHKLIHEAIQLIKQ